MQKIIITNKGLDFQKQVKEEEREAQFLKNIQKEKLDSLREGRSGAQDIQRPSSQQHCTSEKLFYHNTAAHFHLRKQQFRKEEEKNALRGVYQNFLVKRDRDYSEQKHLRPPPQGSEALLAKSTKALDSAQSNTDQFVDGLSQFVPPALCPANKVAPDLRINHLTQTQLNFNLRPVLLHNQGTNNFIDRMEKKRLQYINETLGHFSRLKLNNQIEKEKANQNTFIPPTKELFQEPLAHLDAIINSSQYEKQRYKDRIKAYHQKNFQNQRATQQAYLEKQQSLKHQQDNTLSLDFNK